VGDDEGGSLRPRAWESKASPGDGQYATLFPTRQKGTRVPPQWETFLMVSEDDKGGS